MTQEQKIIRAKVGLLELAKQLGNVSQACKMMGAAIAFTGSRRCTTKVAGLTGDQSSQAHLKEPHTDRDRAGSGGSGDRTAGLGQVRISETLKRRGLSATSSVPDQSAIPSRVGGIPRVLIG